MMLRAMLGGALMFGLVGVAGAQLAADPPRSAQEQAWAWERAKGYTGLRASVETLLAVQCRGPLMADFDFVQWCRHLQWLVTAIRTQQEVVCRAGDVPKETPEGILVCE